MKKIKDFNTEDKPREKLSQKGPSQMTMEDLVAIIIGSGTKGVEVRKIASDISGVYKKKAYKVLEEDLCKIKGIGKANACKIIAAVEFGSRVGPKKQTNKRIEMLEPKDVWEELADIRKSKKEHFVILYLNARNKEIERDVVSIGTISASLVHPREVYKKAIEHEASIIIAAHNHPSNEVEPSDADINITRRLSEASKILGIELQDHVIVSRDSYYSIRENYEEFFD